MENATITRKDYGRKYRIYPNKEQIRILESWIRNARSYTNELIWNQTKTNTIIYDSRV